MKTTKARVFVFLTLVILTAVFSANALTANATAATTDTAASQQSGFIASSFNNILSFFGLAEAAKPAAASTGCDTAPEGLLACYGGDHNAYDAKGIHTGEWVGASRFADGKTGTGAFSFDGGSTVEIQNSPDLNVDSLTVDGWVNLSNRAVIFGLISKGDAYSLEVRNGNPTFVSMNADGVREVLTASNRSIDTDKWVHIAATHDGTTRRLYIDGQEVARDEQKGLFTGDESTLKIGSTRGLTVDGVEVAERAPFVGLVDEVKIFGRALTEREIGVIAEGDRPNAPNAAITITPATLTVAEATAGVVPITFTRAAGANAGLMTLDFTTGTGTLVNGVGCNPGDDGVSQSAVAWGAGQTQLVLNLTVCNDAVPEPTETLIITITSAPAGDTFAGQSSTITVTDEDAITSISAVSAPSLEDAATQLSYTFSRAGVPNNFPLRVNFTHGGGPDAADNNAAPTIDDLTVDIAASTCDNETVFINSPNTGFIDIPTGLASCTLVFDTLTDLRVEPDENYVITLAAGNYTISPTVGANTKTGVILNDDFSAITLNSDPGESTEGNPGAAGSVAFDPERIQDPNSQLQTLNIRFETTGSGCGTDYTVTVGGGNQVTAFNCINATTGRGVFQYIGAEDDPINLPVVTFVDDSRVEADEPVTMTILAFDAPGADLPGVLNNSNTYTIGADSNDTATIDDDDETITVAPANSPLSEAGPGGIQFNVVRNFNSVGGAVPDNDPAVTDVLTVNFSISSLAPTATQANCTGSDFTVSSGSNEVVTYNPVNCTGTIAFPAGGDVNGQILVTPVNDNLPENNETFTLTITPNTGGPANNYGIGPVVGPDGAVSGTATADGQINNDDLQVIVGVAPASVTEGSPSAPNATNIIYTFTRIGETNNPTCANFNATGVSASALTDYTTSFGAATIAPCTNAFTATAGVSPGSIGIPAGAGNPDNIGGVQANQATFIVNPTDDADVEADEEVQIQVDNHTGIGQFYTPGNPAQASGLILNDDAVVSITVAPNAVLEDGAANLVYTFERTGGTALPLTVTYNLTGSAGLDAATDFEGGVPTLGNGKTIIIPGGNASTTLVIDPKLDTLVEADETATATLVAGAGYTVGAPGAAAGTITNDDTGVSVVITGSQGTNTAKEGNVAPYASAAGTLTATFTRTSTVGALSVNFVVTSDTGALQSDFTGATLSNDGNAPLNVASFADGSATATVVLNAVADNDVEPNDNLTVTLKPGLGYADPAGAGATSTGVILNDDNDIACTGPTGGAVGTETVVTEGGTLTYTCTRTSAGAAGAANLAIPFTVTGSARFLGGNAADPNDYTIGGAVSGVSQNGTGATGTLTFTAGNPVATITIASVDDGVVEGDETVIVGFNANGSDAVNTIGVTAPGPQGYDLTGTSLTGTIGNNDNNVSVAVSITNPDAAGDTVSENGGRGLRYTFTRTSNGANAAQQLDVNFGVAGTACALAPCSGASSARDYVLTGAQTWVPVAGAGGAGTVRFPAGSASNTQTVSFIVTPEGDAIVEPNETVITTVNAGTGYTPVTATSVTGNIGNDDTTYTIQFWDAVNNVPFGAGQGVTEGNPIPNVETLVTFRVFRNGQNSPAGNVDVSTVPGSGTAVGGAPNTVCQPGQDYTADGRTLVFNAAAIGETSTFQDFTIRVCRDLAFELPETFDAQLTNPTGGFLGAPAVATATIIDDDAAPTLSINSIQVNENAGTATLTVTQSIVSTLNTSFSFSTGAMGDTATAGADYTSSSSTGSIPAGSTTASIVIPIIDDNIDEPNEFFTVTLGAMPTNATINVGTGTVTIIDNEPNTQFAINNVVQIEGNPSAQDPTVASTSAFNFRITRTGDAQASETVCFRTVNGDIENPAVNPNPAIGGPGGTIPSNVGEPDYTTRAAGPTNCVTFTQGGASVITVPVIVYGDLVAEFDESFTLEIVSVQANAGTANPGPVETNPVDQNGNPRITDRLGLGVIQNDDGAPSIALSVASPVTEGNTPSTGGSVTFTVTRTGSTSNPVTANWATSTGSGTSAATAGASCALNNAVDFVTSSGSITIAAGSSTTTFTVPYCGDLYDELNESFTATLSNPSNGVISTASATATINDDDAAPIISVSDISVCEPESGTAAAVFTITRTGASYLTSTVNVNTVDGTATTTDSDYVGILTPGGQQFSFGPTVTTLTVPVTVNGDTKFETDETFTLQIVGASSDVVVDPVGGADPIGLGVIVNSGAGCTGDAAPSFALGPVTQAEGNGAAGTSAPFYVRLTRTGTTQVPTVITYSTSTSGGTATGGSSCTAGVDFINISNATVAFAANGFASAVGPPASGPNFIDLPVQVCQDATFEPNETFNVVINSAGGAGVINPTGSPALVTIVNDDGLAFAVRFPGPEGAEGNVGNTAFTFTIDRIGDSSVASNVCYQTVAGTATEGTDYIGLTAGAANCVNFTAGTMSANVSVTVVGDTTPELDETFFLRLISATAGTIPVSPAGDRVATINNDDGPIPVAAGFEGDIVDGSGGAAGDNLVLANDVSAIRQYVLNGTGWVTTPNQFQRADVNLPCGNGQIDSGDVTVIRSILLNSTALVAACGPTVVGGVRPEAERGESPEVVGRIIRAVNTTTTAGQTVAVSFQLDSQGDEASASFTVNWNPAVFTYVSSAAGAGVPTGTNLGVNTSQTAAGRLGVLLDATNTYAAGTRQILTVTFTVAANAAVGTYPVTFSSTPTAQSVSNAQGALLATTYEAGNIVIGPTAAGVRVSGRVTTAGGQALRNATVILTDSEGNRRTVTTGSFGIYAFEDVEAGQSYVVGVSAKRYRFASRVVNVTDSLADVDFVGQE